MGTLVYHPRNKSRRTKDAFHFFFQNRRRRIHFSSRRRNVSASVRQDFSLDDENHLYSIPLRDSNFRRGPRLQSRHEVYRCDQRKTDAISRNADAQLRLADARLRDVDAKILKDTKRQNAELRRDNQAQRQAGPNRQEDYVHMKIDVDESMRELMQTEIRKYHSVHDNTKLLKNLTESMTRMQNDLGQLKAAANSSGNEAGEIHDKDVHDEDVYDKDDKEVLVLKHDFTKESPFKDNGWSEYKSGFGKKEDKNYWLGLEKIHQITSSGSWNLKVRVKYDILFGGQPDPLAGTIGEAQWRYFSIAGESDQYRLRIGEMTSSSNFP